MNTSENITISITPEEWREVSELTNQLKDVHRQFLEKIKDISEEELIDFQSELNQTCSAEKKIRDKINQIPQKNESLRLLLDHDLVAAMRNMGTYLFFLQDCRDSRLPANREEKLQHPYSLEETAKNIRKNLWTVLSAADAMSYWIEGEKKIHRENINLIDFLKEAEDSLNFSFDMDSHKKINIKYPPSISDIEVNIHQGTLGTILKNICRNAGQAGAENLEINIIAETNQIKLEISDDGPGIKEEIADKIFELGFTTKKSGQGIGLGKAPERLQEFNGEIIYYNGGLKNTEKGNGVKFVITLSRLLLIEAK